MSHILNNHILCCPCCNWAMKPPDVHRICTSARQLQMVVLHGPHTNCAEHCRTQSWSATSIRDDFISIFSRFQEFGHIFFDGKIVQVWMSQSSILQNIAYFIWCHDLTKSSAQKLQMCRNIQMWHCSGPEQMWHCSERPAERISMISRSRNVSGTRSFEIVHGSSMQFLHLWSLNRWTWNAHAVCYAAMLHASHGVFPDLFKALNNFNLRSESPLTSLSKSMKHQWFSFMRFESIWCVPFCFNRYWCALTWFAWFAQPLRLTGLAIWKIPLRKDKMQTRWWFCTDICRSSWIWYFWYFDILMRAIWHQFVRGLKKPGACLMDLSGSVCVKHGDKATGLVLWKNELLTAASSFSLRFW
jgi:hypothetical protein